MDKNKIKVTDELIDRYLCGDVNESEILALIEAMSQDEELQELIATHARFQELYSDEDDYEDLPMTRLAASAKRNLCDVLCEQFILSKHGIHVNESDLTEESLSNRWLKEKGTPLYNIGRLLETSGLQVSRGYDTTIQKLQDAILAGENVIVVVNRTKLTSVAKSTDPNHAIVVLDRLVSDHKIRIYDPASTNPTDIVDENLFMKAWADSKFYMVTAQESDGVYRPNPIQLDDVQLDNDLLELREAIAENAHEVWASMRMAEGIKYGPVRDEKHNPCMVPYAQLPESEKEYDRSMAFQTIKLLQKLGYEIVKNDHSPLYCKLMNRIKARDSAHKCPKCGEPFFISQAYCESCGRPIGWKDII